MMIESGSLGPYSGGEKDAGALSIGSALPYKHNVEMISKDLYAPLTYASREIYIGFF
jgi:hypothetical protein